MTRRAWEWHEDELLRREHSTSTAAELAEQLGRGRGSVHARVGQLGLARSKPTLINEEELEQIRLLNAEGLTDTEIADRLNRERHGISRRRRAMGLPDRGLPSNPRQRAKIAAGVRRQCERLGVESMSHARIQGWKKRTRELGWPDDLRPRAVQILHVLYHEGPKTRRQLCEAIGMRWRGTRQSLTSNDPEGSYLAHLMARGLVVSLGRIDKRPGEGKGSSCQVYSLPLHVRPNPQPTPKENT